MKRALKFEVTMGLDSATWLLTLYTESRMLALSPSDGYLPFSETSRRILQLCGEWLLSEGLFLLLVFILFDIFDVQPWTF